MDKPDNSTCRVRAASWEQDATAIKEIRTKVFIQEQNVPEEIESDDYDPVSWYVLALAPDDAAVACARLQPNGKVTRIAVLAPWRRKGVARQMLSLILEIARENELESLYLHAQLSAIELYKEFGFTASGKQFTEAGIEHIKMIRVTTPDPG